MDSAAQESSEGKAVVTVLAAVLERLVESNARLQTDQDVTKFHALKAPGISVRQYLERVSMDTSLIVSHVIVLLFSNIRISQLSLLVLTHRYINMHPARPSVSSLHSSISIDWFNEIISFFPNWTSIVSLLHRFCWLRSFLTMPIIIMPTMQR